MRKLLSYFAIVKALMREQFNSLKALIDAIVTLDSAVIEGDNTLPAGTPSQVSVTVMENTLHFIFGISSRVLGPPGEVTADQVTEGLDTRAYAVYEVPALAMTDDGDYSSTQLQDIIYADDAAIWCFKRVPLMSGILCCHLFGLFASLNQLLGNRFAHASF